MNFNFGLKGFGALGGLATIGAVIASWLSPQQKTKRLRIELEHLQQRKAKILSDKPTIETSKELVKIMDRVQEINLYLKSREE